MKCFLDEGIGRIKKACDENGYVLMVTSDHGNAEQMISKQGGPHTAHTTNRGNNFSLVLEFNSLFIFIR